MKSASALLDPVSFPDGEWNRGRADMQLELHLGDITKVRADAVCSSTNPNLELMAGTGGALREAGGWQIQLDCHNLIEAEFKQTGHRWFAPGTTHWTTPGTLPFRGIIHAVAIDPFHNSSEEIISQCVTGALTLAATHEINTLALPVFASGNGQFDFEKSLRVLLDECSRHARSIPRKAIIVVHEPVQQAIAQRVFAELGFAGGA